MNSAALTWFTIGACLIFLVTQDLNFYDWLILKSKQFRIWIQQQWFLVRYNPDSPWVRWEINRNANRFAKEFLSEKNK